MKYPREWQSFLTSFTMDDLSLLSQVHQEGPR